MFPQCAYQSSRSRSINAGSCFSPSPTERIKKVMRVVLKRWQLGSFSSTIFFLEDQKGKGIPCTASGAAQRLVCLRSSAGRIKEADETHGAIAEQIDVAIHLG